MVITTNGEGVGRGLFQQGDALVRIESAQITTDYRPDSLFHTGLLVDCTLEDGSHRQITGQVMGYIPLRNRRGGQNTHVGEGMTRYTLDDSRVGYGLSEYLTQPPEAT